jgi:phage tail sheath protein FI
MPEYLAPGVYIEEVSFRSKTIEGVGTSNAGFIGPARYGPVQGEPELLTSFSEFERIYGGLDGLDFEGDQLNNYLAHAVRAFFEEGGSRLYVSRAYRSRADANSSASATPDSSVDGYAQVSIESSGSPMDSITLRSRYPGSGGNVQITFTARPGQNVLAGVPRDPTDLDGEKDPVLRGVSEYDLVWISDRSSPIDSPPGSGTLYWAERVFDHQANQMTWRFHPEQGTGSPLNLSELDPDLDLVSIVTVDVEVVYPGTFPRSEVWENLAFHPAHRSSLSKVFGPVLNNRLRQLTVPIVVQAGSLLGPAIARVLLDRTLAGASQTILEGLGDQTLGVADRQFTVRLRGGNDGVRPEAGEYEGQDSDDPSLISGLKAFENVADISIVCAPGSTYGYSNGYQAQADQIIRHLISHCERMRYRIGVIDSANDQAISGVRTFRGQIDSKHAALYYPWITILDPVSGEELNLPPSGAVAGIYARNDVQHGVHKAPANEVVRTAIGLEYMLNKAQQDVLNPLGVNCFRFFLGRGYRLWGARTISSDPEWKYVNLRRYFAYLERSIERGTQWAVFEPNGDALWANVTRTVEDFLFNEWQSGHLFGRTPEEAYFVRCDRTTMTQNDIDNGRLICLVGVAPLRPAEFVIFRIGQWTADAR